MMLRLSPVTASVLLVSVLFVFMLLSSHQSLLSLTQRSPFMLSRGSGSECDLIYEVETGVGTGTGTGVRTRTGTETAIAPLIIRVPRQNIKITQAQAQALIENRNTINTLPIPITTQAQTQSQIQQTPAPVKPLADGCHSVYLDLGTNIGVQIRKLYEPQLFPIAIIRHRFVDYFGTGDRKHVCSFGWEPNPRHVPWLSHQEYIYRSLGYRTHIFTTSGVYDKEDMAEFVTDKSYDNNEWAGKTKTKTDTTAGTTTPTTTTGTTNNNAEQDKFTVHLFDFGQWYKTHILPRSIPDSEVVAYGPPRVLLKLDIEGPDWKIVAQLVRMGLWCTLDFVYQEHLTIPQREVLDAMQKEFGTACPTKTTLMDDETYHRARFPFPLVPAGAAAAGATWLDRFPLPKPWDLSVQGPLPTHKPYDESNKP